jgi:ParB family chromosome partitioning protein
MFAPMNTGRDIDLHRLELRYASARLIDSRAVERLARSIDRCGQLIPCIVVADAEHLVVVDGYRRIAALRRLSRDTASVEQWECDLAQALLNVLARTQSRPFAAIEEALLLHELVSGLQLSQREVASRSGRDVSWVQRRLQLLVALPDPLLDAVRAGQLSTWAATRIFAPLARANTDHAQRLLAAMQSAPLSTRELKLWFGHYQGAQHALRERLVSHPRLFVDSLVARDEQRASERLGAGPEGLALTDLRRLEGFLRSVRKRLAVLTDPVPEPLAAACVRVATAWRAVQYELTRLVHDDTDRDPQCRPDPASSGSESARDQPPAQALA